MRRLPWGLLFLLAVLPALLVGCKEKPLLEGLEERQANEVISALLHDNIAAQKQHEGKAGFSVLVGSADLAQAIDLIHRAELPSPARRHVSADFASDGMVSTPQADRVRLLSSIEQRLEESLTQFSGVMSSRVHASYPTEATGLKARSTPAMHVSALLVMNGDVDEAALIQSVKRLLRNSFEGVAYEDISVLVTAAPMVRPTEATPDAPSYGAPWIWLLLTLGIVTTAASAVYLSGSLRTYPLAQARRWWKRRSERTGTSDHDA